MKPTLTSIVLFFCTAFLTRIMCQNISVDLKTNYRITPVYLGQSTDIIAPQRDGPRQAQDIHLSGHSISTLLRYHLNKTTYLTIESGIRYDHLFYKPQPNSGSPVDKNVKAWMQDHALGLGVKIIILQILIRMHTSL